MPRFPRPVRLVFWTLCLAIWGCAGTPIVPDSGRRAQTPEKAAVETSRQGGYTRENQDPGFTSKTAGGDPSPVDRSMSAVDALSASSQNRNSSPTKADAKASLKSANPSVADKNDSSLPGDTAVGAAGAGPWNGIPSSNSLKSAISEGFGQHIFPDGRKYVGKWHHGKMNGQGTMFYPDGRKYIGNWQNGKTHGYGELTSPDGRSYQGQWHEGMIHGHGTLTYPDGTIQSGLWQEGRFVGN